MLSPCVYAEEHGKFLVLWMLSEAIVISETHDGEGAVCKCIVSSETLHLEVSRAADAGHIACCLFTHLKFHGSQTFLQMQESLHRRERKSHKAKLRRITNDSSSFSTRTPPFPQSKRVTPETVCTERRKNFSERHM